MVVCKFFQAGNCRYGKNCRFDHIYGSRYNYHANPQQQQQQITQPAAVPAQPGIVTDEQLVNQVQTDVQAALRGGQWILSCYSPFKEKPIFPGLTDLSPEEARLFIYEAKATNNVDHAVNYMNNLFKETRQKYETLLQPNVNIIKTLRSLYKGEMAPSPFSNVQQNMISNTNNINNASSIFRSAMQTAPIVTSVSPQSVFRQVQNNTIFNPQAADPARQLFSQASTNVFGPSQPPGVFSPPQNQNVSAKSIFATANQSNNFNTGPVPAQNSPSNIFAAANRDQSQSSSPFSQGNVFQTAPNPASVFAQASKPQVEHDPAVYSKMEELSECDLEAFKSDQFQLGFIPELPPPVELCMGPLGKSYFG